MSALITMLALTTTRTLFDTADNALDARDAQSFIPDEGNTNYLLARAKGDDESGAGFFSPLGIIAGLASSVIGGIADKLGKPKPAAAPAAPPVKAAASPKAAAPKAPEHGAMPPHIPRRDFVVGDLPVYRREQREMVARSLDELD
ncbi:hypothetical protein EIP91_006741 [Steccherinum ochraceum]|uniref:Uncharacterized protein n=1 Tax=Steccherinum ochraceum TaxID=92696 RepID=A0A4R0R800_9APHY|nr:hypothetical protein EIP91_006741 [Steccherinum ochraceum]